MWPRRTEPWDRPGIKALQRLDPCFAFFNAAAILIFLYPLTDAR
jgi:hypothetical protein